MEDFARYFKEKRLGKLSFPNGKCVPRSSSEGWDFFINLDELYKMVTGWQVKNTLVPPDDIVAVIAFGSAVRFPGFEDTFYNTRRYFFFGPVVRHPIRRPIQPNDVDFLVITSKGLARKEVLEAKTYCVEYYDCTARYVEKGGIDLISCGADEFLASIRADDTVSHSALREGVPVFFDDRFNNLLVEAGVAQETPRTIFWDEDREGNLIGKIE